MAGNEYSIVADFLARDTPGIRLGVEGLAAVLAQNRITTKIKVPGTDATLYIKNGDFFLINRTKVQI